MTNSSDDQKYLLEIQETDMHLSSRAFNQLPRLEKILKQEEVLIIFYIDLELSQNKASDISLEELSKIIMGGRDKPTAVRLLFEMLGGNPYEPSRLEAGKTLFEKAKMKISNYKNEDINVFRETLKSGLVSSNDAIRNTSLWCLFKLWGTEAFEICSYAFSDHNYMARFETARLFGFLKDKRAVPVLIEALKEEKTAKMRSVILWALGYIKDPEALKILLVHLHDEDKEAGGYAAWALGKIGGVEALEALKTAVEDSKLHNEVRLWALKALYKIKGQTHTNATAD